MIVGTCYEPGNDITVCVHCVSIKFCITKILWIVIDENDILLNANCHTQSYQHVLGTCMM